MTNNIQIPSPPFSHTSRSHINSTSFSEPNHGSKPKIGNTQLEKTTNLNSPISSNINIDTIKDISSVHDHTISSTVMKLNPLSHLLMPPTLYRTYHHFILLPHPYLHNQQNLNQIIRFIPKLKMLRHLSHYCFNNSRLDERRRHDHRARQHQCQQFQTQHNRRQWTS